MFIVVEDENHVDCLVNVDAIEMIPLEPLGDHPAAKVCTIHFKTGRIFKTKSSPTAVREQLIHLRLMTEK